MDALGCRLPGTSNLIGIHSVAEEWLPGTPNLIGIHIVVEE